MCVHTQLCLTLRNLKDSSLPGSSVHGIFQVRSCSGLPFPTPGDLPDPGVKLGCPSLAGGFFTTEPPGKPLYLCGVEEMAGEEPCQHLHSLAPFINSSVSSPLPALVWQLSYVSASFLKKKFWPCCMAWGILVRQPGMELVAPAEEVQSPNHWTAKEIPCLCL